MPLAKLLSQNLRAAGVSGATSSSSEEKKKSRGLDVDLFEGSVCILYTLYL